MIRFILLIIFTVSLCESAIFYVDEKNRNEDPLKLEFFKLLGLRVNTNSNNLNNVFTTQTEKIDSGILEESVTQNCGPDQYDYKKICKSLVGTSSIPLCRHTQNHIKDEEKSLPRSCQEILERGNNKSGIYKIYPRTSSKPFWVLCDMEISDGGWTHIQKRFDGSQDFYLPWRDYKFGFGDLEGEFWIGLENIYHMTGFEINELLIELTDRELKKYYAKYTFFAIGPEKEGYILKNLTGYSGDASDSMTYHLGYKFTTSDVNQDIHPENCAVLASGAWWYKNCYACNLNGKYMNQPLNEQYKYHGLSWNGIVKDGINGNEYKLAGSRMLVRSVGNK